MYKIHNKRCSTIIAFENAKRRSFCKQVYREIENYNASVNLQKFDKKYD